MGQKSPLDNLWDGIEGLCAGLSYEWIRKAIASDPFVEELFTETEALDAWRNDRTKSTLRNVWPQAQLAMLRRLQSGLRTARLARRECIAIHRCLYRQSLKTGLVDWRDVLVDAVAEHTRLNQLARTDDPVVTNWLNCVADDRPPEADDLVPPLWHVDLICLRKAIDKHRKRGERDVARGHRAVAALNSRAKSSDAGMVADFEVLERALNELSADDRLLYELRADGLTFDSIGAVVHRPKSVVHARLNIILQQLTANVQAADAANSTD